MRPPSVLLIGAAGSGKDTVADYLADRHGYAVFHVADPLKRLLGDPAWKPVWEVLYPEGPPPKLRRELQEVGDLLRHWDPAMLVKMTTRAIQHTIRQHPGQPWCLADIRLVDEFQAFHTQFPHARVLGLTAPDPQRAERLAARDGQAPPGDWAAHPTERQTATLFQMGVCDTTIANTGTLADLHRAVDAAITAPSRTLPTRQLL